MYAAIAFALLSVASAVPALNYGYGLNAYNPYGYGLNAVHAYGSPVVQKVVSPYAVQKTVVAPQVYGVPAVHGVVAPKVYGGHLAHGVVERDYNIESVGERYTINNGVAQLSHHFVKDVAPGHIVHQKVVSPAAYGGYYGALRTGPVVQKVDTFGVKTLY